VDSHTFLGNYSVTVFYVSTDARCLLLGRGPNVRLRDRSRPRFEIGEI